MTDLRIQPLLPSEATLCIEGKNAHLFYDGNTGARRDIIEDFKGYGWHKLYMAIKMDCLTDTMDTNAEDATEYQLLIEEWEKAKEKASKDKKIIRALAHLNLEKIYVYE